jgi:hypothetical protein
VHWLAVITAHKLTIDEKLFLGFELSGAENKDTPIAAVQGL